MRRVYLRIAAAVVVASIVGWAAVGFFAPRIVGRFVENGLQAPLITGGIRLLAADLEAAPRDDWPMRLATASRELAVPVAIVPYSSLPTAVRPRLRQRDRAVMAPRDGAPTFYVSLATGTDVLMAGPLPPPPLKPLIIRGVILALVLTVTVSAAIGLPLVARLRRLRHAIGDLGSGNLAVRVDPNEGELSELANGINGMASRLERQFQEREALLQAVSHEMGTPLSRMRFAIEMMDDEPRRQLHSKRMLTADLDELDRLSSELVAWIEPESTGARRREFRVAPVIESLVAIEPPQTGTPVRITVSVMPALTVMADQHQFQRAIENLLRNALRYARRRIVVNSFADGERVIVEVRDDGPGIAREQRARVLDPFVTFEGGRSGARRRLGLGLAIVRRIVEAHGGSVVIAEAPEGGARVTTCWPRGFSSTLIERGPNGLLPCS